MFHIKSLTLTASPIPIRAELTGSRCCSAVGLSINAYAPVGALARKLLRNGFGPEQMLEVYRGNTLCFQVMLGAAARLKVEDSSDGRPRFRRYRPSESLAVTPPIAPNAPAAIQKPAGTFRATSKAAATVPVPSHPTSRGT
jgi:hypothetical protein